MYVCQNFCSWSDTDNVSMPPIADSAVTNGGLFRSRETSASVLQNAVRTAYEQPHTGSADPVIKTQGTDGAKHHTFPATAETGNSQIEKVVKTTRSLLIHPTRAKRHA